MFTGPRAAGTWMGFQNSIGNASGVFGPILTGFIVQRAGYDSAFVVTAIIAGIGAVWWAVLVPRIEQIQLD
jgi:predicted MFS family arabinose efflux permease